LLAFLVHHLELEVSGVIQTVNKFLLEVYLVVRVGVDSLLASNEGFVHPVEIAEVGHLLSHGAVVVTVELQHLVLTLR